MLVFIAVFGVQAAQPFQFKDSKLQLSHLRFEWSQFVECFSNARLSSRLATLRNLIAWSFLS